MNPTPIKRPVIAESNAVGVQKFANKHFDGDFTRAVNYLISRGINENRAPGHAG